jgi:hypothetical protein
MTEPKGCPTPGACSCLGENSALRYVIRSLEKQRDDLQAYNTAEVEHRRKAEETLRSLRGITDILQITLSKHSETITMLRKRLDETL